MSLGGAYGGQGLSGGMGVPRIARKADGKYAIFADYTALAAYYNTHDKPTSDYAACVGTTNADGSIATLTAAYVWSLKETRWDAVPTDLRGADGSNGLTPTMRGAWTAGTYRVPDMVRYQSPGSNKFGIYQCVVASTTNNPTHSDWLLMFEESYIAPIHRKFDFEPVLTTVPTAVPALGTPYTRATVSWNVKEWLTDLERVTAVVITRPDGVQHSCNTAEIAAQQLVINTNINKPQDSFRGEFIIEVQTSLNNTVTKSVYVNWNSKYYYGFSSLGDVGTPMTEAGAKLLTDATATTYPNSLTIARAGATSMFAYLIIPADTKLPTEYVMGGISLLFKHGTVTIDGYAYQIYRTNSKTHTTSLNVVSG